MADLTIDVAACEEIPRKGGPAVIRSALLVINKIDLGPHLGVSLEMMRDDAKHMCGERSFVFTTLRKSDGADVTAFIRRRGGLQGA